LPIRSQGFYISGNFLLVDGQLRRMIARLGPDGSLSSIFTPVILTEDDDFPEPVVNDIEVLADGKVLIGGQFQLIDDFDQSNYARLNFDGTVDESFNVGSGARPLIAQNFVRHIELQSDGKILLAGNFDSLNGVSAPQFGRLESDGTPDPDFRAEPGSRFEYTVGTVTDILVEQNGDILLSGSNLGGRFGTNIVRIKSVPTTEFLPPIILKLLEE